MVIKYWKKKDSKSNQIIQQPHKNILHIHVWQTLNLYIEERLIHEKHTLSEREEQIFCRYWFLSIVVINNASIVIIPCGILVEGISTQKYTYCTKYRKGEQIWISQHPITQKMTLTFWNWLAFSNTQRFVCVCLNVHTHQT